MGPNGAATLEVRGHKSGRIISFPVVVADYRASVTWSMLGQQANWVATYGQITMGFVALTAPRGDVG